MLYHYKHLSLILDKILSSGDIVGNELRLQKLYHILFRLAIKRNKEYKNLKFNLKKIYYTSNLISWSYKFMLPNMLGFIEKGLQLNLTINIERADFVLIGGNKLSIASIKDLMLAHEYNKPVFFHEDNFIAYFNGCTTELLSLCFDAEGFYFNYKYPGIRNRLLNSRWKMKDKEKLIAQHIIDSINDYGISKFNTTPYHEVLFKNNGIETNKSVVLVIDQKYGDASVKGASANINTFYSMLNDALEENPDSLILIKTHPLSHHASSRSAPKIGYYDDINYHSRILKCDKDFNSIALLKAVDKVYCVSSQMGLEAAICNKPVYCYGQAFYNGWGFTVDRSQNIYVRKKKRSLQEIIYMYYTQHCYYFNPVKQKLCDVTEIIDYIIGQYQLK